MSGKLQLKQSRGWFAAGQQWQRALRVLSDGAFKLFVYVSCQAERATGRLRFQQGGLARALGKSRRSIQTYLKELEEKQVCRVLSARNQYAGGILEIRSEYWPYVREGSRDGELPSDDDSYVEAIGKMLRSQPCVRSVYSAADRRLARIWLAAGVSLTRVEQAILLGCGRKYATWLNGQKSEPIGSLAFFEPVLEELSQFQLPCEYLDFNRRQAEKYRRKWLALKASQGVPKENDACAKVAQASARPKLETR